MFTKETVHRSSARFARHRQKNSKSRLAKENGAAEHVVGVAKGVSEDIVADLRANFEGECSEVGMYLAMARVAHREGYPEVGLYYEKAAWGRSRACGKICRTSW